MSCFDLTHVPVGTAARAAATGLVSMSTRPDPDRSGTVEIAKVPSRKPLVGRDPTPIYVRKVLLQLNYSGVVCDNTN